MEYELHEYKDEYGPINWQEGFQDELKGKTIEEQIRCYAWAENSTLTEEVTYKEIEPLCREETWMRGYIEPVENKHIIVKDGLVVGVVIQKYYCDACGNQRCRDIFVLPYQGYCYDSTSDNNGAGYKTRDWYKYLVCLPFDHTLWD